jgi:Mn2+/Fe2+ NRAMP family transporter
LTSDRRIMGPSVNGLAINVLGWMTTACIFAATAGLIATWLL